MSKEDRALYDAIYRSMWYHGRRVILGMSADGANQAAHPDYSWQVHHNSYRRRRYRRLREQGMTSYEVKAILRGQTVERVQAEHIQQNRVYRAKWGGDPSHVGSDAWKRRTLAAHGMTLEGDPYRGRVPARWARQMEVSAG